MDAVGRAVGCGVSGASFIVEAELVVFPNSIPTLKGGQPVGRHLEHI